MSAETQIKLIEEKLKALISGEPALFLVETRIKPTNNIKVYIMEIRGLALSDWFIITGNSTRKLKNQACIRMEIFHWKSPHPDWMSP
jgi:ribosome maturation factor RimP